MGVFNNLYTIEICHWRPTSVHGAISAYKGGPPTVPESLSTLAGQLMNRSWLYKTMSQVNKKQTPGQIMAILRMLLHYGLDVNTPIDATNHAAKFARAQDRWEIDLCIALASFLCEKSASPFEPNIEGKTPYDLALLCGNQDLLLIFVPMKAPVELCSVQTIRLELSSVQTPSPVELSS